MTNLRDTFRTLFPDRNRREDPFAIPPALPADIFAFCAFVLEASGAYHHIAPEVAQLTDPARRIVVDEALRNRAEAVGMVWRASPKLTGQLPEIPGEVIELWKGLGLFAREEVFTRLGPGEPAPKWWLVARSMPEYRLRRTPSVL